MFKKFIAFSSLVAILAVAFALVTPAAFAGTVANNEITGSINSSSSCYNESGDYYPIDVTSFSVTVSGEYTFTNKGATWSGGLTYFNLFDLTISGWNPATDINSQPGFVNSGLPMTANLIAGHEYILVVDNYENYPSIADCEAKKSNFGSYAVGVTLPPGGAIVSASGPPRLNEWNAEYEDETRAFAYDMPDSAYGRPLVWNGAWEYNPGSVPANLVNAGVLFAVDVWIYDGSGNTVFDFGGYQRICLEGEGRLIFLDATTSPREQHEILPVTFEGGYTCGWIPNAGTVVLIEG